MASIFSKIISGDIPAFKIAEDEHFFAFLDVFPLAKGHVLVVPKVEIDYIFDLDNDTLVNMHIFAKKIAQAMKKAITCKRIGMAVIGLEVAHAHIHLIPLNSEEDIHFSKPKLKLEQTEFEAIANQIKMCL